ncbi:hypothetical protein JCM11251_003032 [Rhodosporidiobolus azoricus]
MFSSLPFEFSLASMVSSRVILPDGRVSYLSAVCQPHFLPFALPTSGVLEVGCLVKESFEEWNGDAPVPTAAVEKDFSPTFFDSDLEGLETTASAFSGTPSLRRSTSSSSLASSTESSLFSDFESTSFSSTSSGSSLNDDHVDISTGDFSSCISSSMDFTSITEASGACGTSAWASSDLSSTFPPACSPSDLLPSPFLRDSCSKRYPRHYLDALSTFTGNVNSVLPSSWQVEEEQVHCSVMWLGGAVRAARR